MRTLTYLMGLLMLAGGCSTSTSTETTTTAEQLIIGADTDEHGCKGSAGYQWSAVQQQCVPLSAVAIRLDPAGADRSQVAYLLFASPDNDAQAEVFLPGQPGRLLAKKPGDEAGTWTLDTLTLRHWKGMYSLNGAKETVLFEGHAEIEAELGDVGQSGQDVPTLLAGTWQRVDDPTDRFTIEGKTLTRSTNGKKGLALAFTYVADCGGTACAGHDSPYGCLTTAGEFDIDCQTIAVITATDLALSVGTTDTVARYRKATSR